jgi:hypothetical protein
MPTFIASLCVLLLSLPYALVPYYLLPAIDSTITDQPVPADLSFSSGVYARLPANDPWINVARVFTVILVLGSSNVWILRGRDTILKAMGVERGERMKAGRWVGFGLWTIVVGCACLGGVVAEKIELLGVIAVMAVGWLLPCRS